MCWIYFVPDVKPLVHMQPLVHPAVLPMDQELDRFFLIICFVVVLRLTCLNVPTMVWVITTVAILKMLELFVLVIIPILVSAFY